MLHRSPFARLQEFTAIIKREARLGFFLCNMQFQKNLYHTVVLGSLLVDFLQEFQAIHRFYHRDIRSDILHLIGLKMTDEMPLDILRQGLYLPGKFLFMAFTKDTLPLCVCSFDIFVGMKLTDGYEIDSRRQVAQHFPKISFYIIHSSINN